MSSSIQTTQSISSVQTRIERKCEGGFRLNSGCGKIVTLSKENFAVISDHKGPCTLDFICFSCPSCGARTIAKDSDLKALHLFGKLVARN